MIGFTLRALHRRSSGTAAQRTTNTCVPCGTKFRISTPSLASSHGQTCHTEDTVALQHTSCRDHAKQCIPVGAYRGRMGGGQVGTTPDVGAITHRTSWRLQQS